MSRTSEVERGPRRTALLRWELVAISFVMLLIVAVASIPAWSDTFQPAQWIVYGSLLLLAGFLVYISLFRLRSLETRLSVTQADLDRTKDRLALVIRLGQVFSLAESEDEAIGLALDTCLAVAPARGISYLPFDDRGLVRSMVWRGDLTESILGLAADQLALPAIRASCPQCISEDPRLHNDCTLPLPRVSGVDQIYCLAVIRNQRQLGLVSLFLGEGQKLDLEAETFLTAVLDELSLVIEGHRLRQLDITTRRPRQVPGRTDLELPLEALAEAYYSLSKADFLILTTEKSPLNPPQVACSFGEVPPRVENRAAELLFGASLGDGLICESHETG